MLGLLKPEEAGLYRAQSANDRRHSVECAIAARSLLGAAATGPLIVASALHDVGKTEADLSTPGRVAATLLAAIVPEPRVAAWAERQGLRGRVGLYAKHPDLGAQQLAAAGSHPTVVTWAAEHHLPTVQWSIEAEIADALWAADR